MANLVNLQEFDAELRSLGDKFNEAFKKIESLEKDGWELMREVRLGVKSTRETNEKIVRQLFGMYLVFGDVIRGLQAGHRALTYLVHNNRDGRG